MSSELNIATLSDFVANAEILWAMGLDSVPQVARRSGLFKEVAIPQMTGNTRTFSEIDLEEYAKKKLEDDQSSRARVQQGYSKTGTLYRIAKDIGISYEMRTQGKYMEIKERLTNLGRLAPNRLDLDLQHRITFAGSTTYTDMDGDTVDIAVGDTLALASTAHTLRGSSTTFRNRLANNPQVSRGALEAMELMRVQNTYNQFGEKMVIPADVIWSTDDPNTINTIAEILRSTSNPTQNNPGVINTYSGKYRHVVLPRVATTAVGAVDSTKQKYWGLASTQMCTAYLGMHEEPRLKVPPVDGRSNEEFSTDQWNFGVRAGYLIVIVSAAWFSISLGDGSA
jgi:hypothetical protein